MSRDLTPRESFVFEQNSIAEGRGDKWHFFKSMVVNYNGETFRVFSDEDIALRKQFPVLGKLISNVGEYNFNFLFEQLSNIPGGLDLLHAKDIELATYIETGVGDKESALIKWFEGELDPCFHYCMLNHELFGESLLEEAERLTEKENGRSVDAIISKATKSCEEVNKDIIQKSDVEIEKE